MDVIDRSLDRITRPPEGTREVTLRTWVRQLYVQLQARPALTPLQARRSLAVLDAHALEDEDLRRWLRGVRAQGAPRTARVRALLTHGGEGRVAQLEVSLSPGARGISSVHPLDARAQEASRAALEAALAGFDEDLSVRWQLLDPDDLALDLSGRSLGLALGVAIRRAYLGEPDLEDVGFTGALTAGGRVERVGGVAAKLRAAAAAGLRVVWVPAGQGQETPGLHVQEAERLSDTWLPAPPLSPARGRLPAALLGVGALAAFVAWTVGAAPSAPPQAPAAVSPPAVEPPAAPREHLQLCLLKDGRPAALDDPFRSADSLRVLVTPPAPGWLDLIYADPTGLPPVHLYPDGSGERALLDASSVLLPLGDPIAFDGAPGLEPLYLLWRPATQTPTPPHQAFKGAPAPDAPALLAALPGVEPVEAEGGSGTCAHYRVSDPSRGALLRVWIHHVAP